MFFTKIRVILTALILIILSAEPAVRGICYSPFRDGQNPNGASPTKGQITEDLIMMKHLLSNVPFTPHIRMFGIDKEYLWWIPEVCESLTISYMIAGWTSLVYENTWAGARTDIERFLKYADSLGYAGLTSIMYGYNNIKENTSLYPTETDKINKLIAEINALKNVVRPFNVQITHEENWDVFIRHPGLADSLDFISIRIVPQTDLIGLAEANKYVSDCHAEVKKLFPAKEVIVTTVGWTTNMSCEKEQEMFLNEFISDTSFSYYIFGFADESWKGAKEGYFGMFTSSRQPKLFLYDPLIIDFSNFLPHDSLKLDGVLYNYPSFNYSPDISLTALQNNIGQWADTLGIISQYIFLNYTDIGKANGTITSIFEQNGNNIGLLASYRLDTNIVKVLKENYVGALFTDISNCLYYYGRKDSLGRQKTIDTLRHDFIIPARNNSQNDSIFIGGRITQLSYLDSVIKYPEIIQEFDGFFFQMNLTYLRGIPELEREKYVDSLINAIQTAIGAKRLMVMIDVWCLDCNPGDQDIPSYEAFAKARAKYNFPIIIDDIGNLYSGMNITNDPTKTHKFLLPHRFPTGVNPFVQNKKKGLSLKFAGSKIIINLPGEKAVLSVFDLKGRQVKQETVIGKNSLFDLKSTKLSNGMWIIKLKTNNQTLVRKILFKK